MGEVTNLIASLGMFSALKAWDAQREERTARQEEVFVPFKLPPLPQQEQAISQPLVADRLPVAVAACIS